MAITVIPAVSSGDFFGMLGPGSFFGFFGNFLLAYAPYAIYRALIGHVSPARAGIKGVLAASLGIVVGSIACATFIAWGADLIGLAPFAVLAPIIAINDVLIGLVLALPLLLALHVRAERLGIAYYEVMDPAAAKAQRTGKIGVLLITIGAVGGLLAGMALSMEGLQFAQDHPVAMASAQTQADITPEINPPAIADVQAPEPPPVKILSKAPATKASASR